MTSNFCQFRGDHEPPTALTACILLSFESSTQFRAEFSHSVQGGAPHRDPHRALGGGHPFLQANWLNPATMTRGLVTRHYSRAPKAFLVMPLLLLLILPGKCTGHGWSSKPDCQSKVSSGCLRCSYTTKSNRGLKEADRNSTALDDEVTAASHHGHYKKGWKGRNHQDHHYGWGGGQGQSQGWLSCDVCDSSRHYELALGANGLWHCGKLLLLPLADGTPQISALVYVSYRSAMVRGVYLQQALGICRCINTSNAAVKHIPT